MIKIKLKEIKRNSINFSIEVKMQYGTAASMLFFIISFEAFSCVAILEETNREMGFEPNPEEITGLYGDIDLDTDETNIEEPCFGTNPLLEVPGLFEGDIKLGDGEILDLLSVNPNKWPDNTMKYYITPRQFNRKQRDSIRKGGLQI